jgi:hypothetical protein
LQRKRRKRNNLKQTKHRQAVADPETRQKLGILKCNWSCWDGIQRGDRLRELVEKHRCTIRGLAKDLKEQGAAEATLRRYITLSKVPPEERQRLKEGETAKRVLERKAARDRKRVLQERIKEERKTGAISDEIAEIIIDFATRRHADLGIGFFVSGIPHLLIGVRAITRGCAGLRAVQVPLPKNISLVEFYKKARPARYPGEDGMEHWQGWLSNILVTLAPELEIRETAMNKAEERSFSEIPLKVWEDLEDKWTKRLKSLRALPTAQQQEDSDYPLPAGAAKSV